MSFPKANYIDVVAYDTAGNSDNGANDKDDAVLFRKCHLRL